MNSKLLKISLLYFLIIAVLGTLIRFGFLSGFFLVNYKYMLHAHSHLAFLGWIYPVLFISIVNSFLNKEQIINGKYHLQFFITQIILAGMFISFLIQGYGIVSIIFSTIFQFLTYWFTFRFFRDWKMKPSLEKTHNSSVKFIKTGLIALVVSSFGTWGLAVIGAKGMAGTTIYELAIYFYLHFQYNGWFTFSILGFFIWILESNKVEFSTKDCFFSLKLLAVSLFPAFLLSVLGKNPGNLVIFIAVAAGVAQMAGTIYFLKLQFKVRKDLSRLFNNYEKVLIAIAAISFSLKTILQLMSALPIFTEIAFNNRYIVIAYIHLVFIGFISLSLFAYLSKTGGYILNSRVAKTGVSLLVIGFSLTEILLISPVFFILIPDFTTLMFLFSTLMAVGIGLFVLAQFYFRKEIWFLNDLINTRYCKIRLDNLALIKSSDDKSKENINGQK